MRGVRVARDMRGLPAPLTRSDMLEPDLMMPEQFLARRGRRTIAERSPTHRLMAAVLGDAIDRYRKLQGVQSRKAEDERAELRDWLTSEARGWPFAFAVICDALGFDAAAARREILASSGSANGLRVGMRYGAHRVVPRRTGA